MRSFAVLDLMRSPAAAVVLIACGIAGCGSTPLGAGALADGGATAVDGGGASNDGGTIAADGGTTSCAADNECGSGRVCEAGACVDACSMSNPCQGGFTVTCQDGHCRSRCLNDGNCTMGQICEQFVCVPPQCSSAMPCSGTNLRCTAGRCETFTPCTTDAMCAANFVCRQGTCEELPRCLGDGNCATGQICEDAHCRAAPACTGEGDCTSAQDCVGGLCVPHVCRGDGECTAPQVCSGGQCVAPGSTSFVFRVVILTPGGVVRPLETRQLVALALDQNDRPVEGTTFQWESNHPERVSVDQTTGLARGNDQAGTAEIRATATGTAITSPPVLLTNLLPPATDTLRLTLIDRATGALVAGAKVLVGTDVHDVPEGTLARSRPGGAFDVSAFHATHDYLTVLGATGDDLVLSLAPRSALDPAAGLTGDVSLAQVSTQGPVRIGIAGLSSARLLSDFDFQRLFGDLFTSQVSIPGAGMVSIPLPAGFTLSGDLFMGLTVNVKTDYFALGDPGVRAAWSFGGRVDLAEVGGIFGGRGGGGGGMGGGNFLRQALALAERFDHGVAPAVQIAAIPRVTDTSDIDGDGDRTERVPDWRNFRRLTLSPRQKQILRTEVTVSTLPVIGGGGGGGAGNNGVAVIVGVLVPGTGFVPLGITSVTDDDGDRELDPVVVKSAPVHSGLGVGRYAVMAWAADFGGGTQLPTSFSATLATHEAMPTSLELPDFLPMLQGATYAPTTRAMRVPRVEGASLVRVVLQGDAGAWEVYASAGAELVKVLPSVPSGVPEDLAAAATARAEAIVLTEGAGFEALFSGVGSGLQSLSNLMLGFSRAPMARP
jgi:hypothetical protein